MACKALWSQKEVVSNLLKSRLSLFKWVLGSNPYFRSMISILKWRNWLLVKVLVLISILVPVGITAYEINLQTHRRTVLRHTEVKQSTCWV